MLDFTEIFGSFGETFEQFSDLLGPVVGFLAGVGVAVIGMFALILAGLAAYLGLV